MGQALHHFTKFPLALSSGSRAKRAPVAGEKKIRYLEIHGLNCICVDDNLLANPDFTKLGFFKICDHP
jgi:hypothetical protein